MNTFYNPQHGILSLARQILQSTYHQKLHIKKILHNYMQLHYILPITPSISKYISLQYQIIYIAHKHSNKLNHATI